MQFKAIDIFYNFSFLLLFKGIHSDYFLWIFGMCLNLENQKNSVLGLIKLVIKLDFIYLLGQVGE